MSRLLLVLPLLATLCVSGCAPPAASSAAPQKARSAPAPAGLFADATERAGIRFRHTNGGTARYLFPETFGGGCAFLDYDADGWQDILLLSSGELQAPPRSGPPILALYHNNRDGTFTDTTRAAGLDRCPGYGQGLAVGDSDNDGFPDIFVAGYGGCHLFHNEASGVGPWALGPDLKAERPTPDAQHPTPNAHGPTPEAQRPPPLFREVTVTAGVGDTERGPRWASAAAWGDYDHDGRLDLYVCHYARWSPQTDKRCPRPDGSPGYCVPTVYEGDCGTLYHNESASGALRFRDVTRSAGIDRVRGRGLAAAWLDYDGDGNEDLYVANDLDRNLLFHNNGNGTFDEAGATAGVAYGADGLVSSGMGIAVGDYENCGRESLFVTNLNGEGYSLFRSEPGGTFSYATERAGLLDATRPYSGWGVAFFDFDRDGWLDLVCGNGSVHPQVAADMAGITYEEPMRLYQNTGQGAFRDISSAGGAMTRPRAARGLAVGDFDNDGRLDVLCVNRNAPAELLRNAAADTNHWISLRLSGTKSNRDGAGAKVRLRAGGLKQYAECRLSSSYASSPDRRLFFGLGPAGRVDELTIHWPSGQRDRWAGLAAGRRYVATEGQSCRPDRE